MSLERKESLPFFYDTQYYFSWYLIIFATMEGKKKKGCKPILTKLSEERYQELVRLKDKLGYESIYDLVKALVHLELRCMEDYPKFHGGKSATCMDDLKDMLIIYQERRIGERG